MTVLKAKRSVMGNICTLYGFSVVGKQTIEDIPINNFIHLNREVFVFSLQSVSSLQMFPSVFAIALYFKFSL